MLTDPSNIIKTELRLLERHRPYFDRIVYEYMGTKRKMTFFEGIRETVNLDRYPVFEIESDSDSTGWETTRAQRTEYGFTCMLSFHCPKEKYASEYVGALSTAVLAVMNDPANLRQRILNETKWDLNAGLVDTYMLDSLAGSASRKSVREGTIRVVDITWTVKVHETYPECRWNVSSGMGTSQPMVVTVPV